MLIRTRWLTVADVGDELGLTDHGVLALIHRGDVVAANVSLGKARPRWRSAADELARWLVSRESRQPIVSRRRRRSTAITEYV